MDRLLRRPLFILFFSLLLDKIYEFNLQLLPQKQNKQEISVSLANCPSPFNKQHLHIYFSECNSSSEYNFIYSSYLY